MHFSLRYRFNAALLIAWGLAASLFAALAWPSTITSLTVGTGLGIVLGLLQHRALQFASPDLVNSRTAMDVRRALTATPPGRWSIGILWAGFAALAVIGIVAGGARWPFVTLAGLSTQNFIRDAITLGDSRRLTESASTSVPSNNRSRGP